MRLVRVMKGKKEIRLIIFEKQKNKKNTLQWVWSKKNKFD